MTEATFFLAPPRSRAVPNTGNIQNVYIALADMRARELTAAAPLALLIVVLGLFPTLALELTSPTINQMVTPF